MGDSTHHSLFEDAQGLVYGVTLAGFGILLLTHLGLVTGQTAGLAVLISYATGWSFGPVFFVINLPFYWLGWRRMGAGFVIRTFLSVAGLSVLSMLMPGWMSFARVDPLFGAVLFGLVSGSALLALFRHGASLGGIGILGLIVQDRTGFRAGHVQLLFDAGLFAAAFLVLDPVTVGTSFLGAAVVNLVIAINHRRDRYIVA
ncbi:MAG: YitT family protein [Rubellimicrobium sp.]|nr:YitT family protein [Rubellimicrobium sp.]